MSTTITGAAITRAELDCLDSGQARVLAIHAARVLLPRYERAFPGDTRPANAMCCALDLMRLPEDEVRRLLSCSSYREVEAQIVHAKFACLFIAKRRGRFREMTALAAVADCAHNALSPDPWQGAYIAVDLAGEAHRMLGMDADAFRAEMRREIAEMVVWRNADMAAQEAVV